VFRERRMRWPTKECQQSAAGFQIGNFLRLDVGIPGPKIEIRRARFDRRRDAGGIYRRLALS